MNSKTCLKIYEEEFQKESQKAPGLLTSGGYQRLQGVIVAAMQRAYEAGYTARKTEMEEAIIEARADGFEAGHDAALERVVTG